ncbi:MAG: SHOCT domain-containing protein [Beijerinckiaceae bacterium]
MQNLTAEGRSLVEGVAQRNNVSFDAAATLLAALDRGNGTQAQFNHFELGGMGQWSQGGMIMIGDMFNNGLKYKVDQLCNELSNLMRSHQLYEIRESFSATGDSWWPSSFGSPASSGSQNDMSYAVFPNIHRLALRRNGQVTLYDTGNHQISGFSQQQGGNDQNLTFTSQYGTVRLYDLALIPQGADQQAQQAPPVFAQPAFTQPTFVPQSNPPQAPEHPASAAGNDDDMFAKIERLHGLMQKGILSEAEFAAKKKDLLDRL